ncbi:MAG: DUF4265 domain-containing protein [Acidobacteria bacterium]|nr:DUF4265 domain-containing protein [Acidobacteriota bacterium]
MEKDVIKIKIPLPPDDGSGGEAEWVWAKPAADNSFVLKNVPTFAKGLSYHDVVKIKMEDGIPVFDSVVRRGGHSTYRIYANSNRKAPDIVKVIQKLEEMHCEMENATDKIIGVDVLPEADIYAVYKILDDAERADILEFQEGHCGHPLK